MCSVNENKYYFVFIEIATVTTAYNALSAEQLSLSPGQLILVKRKHPDGWWEGELQVLGLFHQFSNTKNRGVEITLSRVFDVSSQSKLKLIRRNKIVKIHAN